MYNFVTNSSPKFHVPIFIYLRVVSEKEKYDVNLILDTRISQKYIIQVAL